jgi:hypothetical protein
VDNIKMNLPEIELGVVDLIGRVQDGNKRRGCVNALMNIWVP